MNRCCLAHLGVCVRLRGKFSIRPGLMARPTTACWRAAQGESWAGCACSGPGGDNRAATADRRTPELAVRSHEPVAPQRERAGDTRSQPASTRTLRGSVCRVSRGDVRLGCGKTWTTPRLATVAGFSLHTPGSAIGFALDPLFLDFTVTPVFSFPPRHLHNGSRAK